MSLRRRDAAGLHTVAACWSQPIHLHVRAQPHVSHYGPGGTSAGPFAQGGGWTTGHIQQKVCDIAAPTTAFVGQSPPQAVCTKRRGTQVWGFLCLRSCSQGNVGG